MGGVIPPGLNKKENQVSHRKQASKHPPLVSASSLTLAFIVDGLQPLDQINPSLSFLVMVFITAREKQTGTLSFQMKAYRPNYVYFVIYSPIYLKLFFYLVIRSSVFLDVSWILKTIH